MLNVHDSVNLTTDYTAKNVDQADGRPVVTYDSRYGTEDCSILSCYSECTATSNQSWATATAVTFLGMQIVTVDVTENTSTSSRRATITVRNKCGKTDTFTVTQEGKPNYVFEWYPEATSSKTISLNNNAANNSRLSVSSYKNGSAIGFSCSSSASWLSCDGVTTNDMGWKVSENSGACQARSGVITLTQNESGKTITLNLTQAKATTFNATIKFINTSDGKWRGIDCSANSDAVIDFDLYITLEVGSQQIANFRLEGGKSSWHYQNTGWSHDVVVGTFSGVYVLKDNMFPNGNKTGLCVNTTFNPFK